MDKVINENACCIECIEGQLGELGRKDWGQGHYQCNLLTKKELEAVKNDAAFVSYEDGRWVLRENMTPADLEKANLVGAINLEDYS